jgi:hypothetical protein
MFSAQTLTRITRPKFLSHESNPPPALLPTLLPARLPACLPAHPPARLPLLCSSKMLTFLLYLTANFKKMPIFNEIYCDELT